MSHFIVEIMIEILLKHHFYHLQKLINKANVLCLLKTYKKCWVEIGRELVGTSIR